MKFPELSLLAGGPTGNRLGDAVCRRCGRSGGSGASAGLPREKISVSFVWTDENENRVEYETKIIFYLNILDDNDRKAFSL